MVRKLCQIKHIEDKKKITDLANKGAEISEKGYDFLLGRMYFTGNDGYQIFLVFASMLSFLILESNRKVANWILTGMLFEKIKPFDTGFIV